jgi:hypothetical protein
MSNGDVLRTLTTSSLALCSIGTIATGGLGIVGMTKDPRL